MPACLPACLPASLCFHLPFLSARLYGNARLADWSYRSDEGSQQSQSGAISYSREVFIVLFCSLTVPLIVLYQPLRCRGDQPLSQMATWPWLGVWSKAITDAECVDWQADVESWKREASGGRRVLHPVSGCSPSLMPPNRRL